MQYPILSLPESGTIRENIGQPTLYIFTANKAEKVTLIVWAGTLQAELYSPSGRELAFVSSGRWQGNMPETGIYRVMIYPRIESTNCAIEVQIERPSPEPKPEPELEDKDNSNDTINQKLSKYRSLPDRPIVIRSGEYNGSVGFTLSARSIQPLTIRCRQGQMMKVTGFGVELAIAGPHGKILETGTQNISTRLPENGVYRILAIGGELPLDTLVSVDVR
ncbi:MAG: hypothetical protein P5702_02840 [Limnospira sp. PMC 1291.21]|uniref:Uncharacterized protein n=3 Tax=Limnospira TaxID=2596745 RepID=A0A9P1KK13_9CYAN|nr:MULTISPECIES: hypothetical protein [Limnospira]EKD08193.1 hypothetical protein SPLC1_S271150 [Arthrospira platensis C1]MDC0839947.1 hypothetical protein [Limnoraphis robusta]MDY7055433.1 hypothetical protein [Limnospira fusiformis LS22]QJB25247.1 hypothetical protein HFV01_04830 [Limnospira fusiformis SAG 85.79]RAQ41173.1 hypothetical protein B9S53_14345 [Arthrospira sp. O9.13F]